MFRRPKGLGNGRFIGGKGGLGKMPMTNVTGKPNGVLSTIKSIRSGADSWIIINFGNVFVKLYFRRKIFSFVQPDIRNKYYNIRKILLLISICRFLKKFITNDSFRKNILGICTKLCKDLPNTNKISIVFIRIITLYDRLIYSMLFA